MATWRARLVSCGIVGMAIVAAGWLSGPAPPTASAPAAQAIDGSLDDLLMDLELIPLDGKVPKPFALPSLDGRRLTLADLAGGPALIYFWATW
jgi:cytochrome oxidase Cu insertion factor (SCO1/SenC/PrrC family)